MAKPGFGKAHVLGIAAVVVAGVGAFAIASGKETHLSATRQALADTVEKGPKVRVISVGQSAPVREIRLLGDTRPYQTATLYSKVAGYLARIDVDRGDMVKAGQVVAVIDSAETDNQLASALTDLDNKRRNAVRARQLVASGSRSVQSIEQAETDARMAEALVAQLSTLQSYEQIKAPFAGRVTARFADVGALVQNATTNQTSNQPIVTIVDDTKLRVNIYVEQRDVPFVHVGDEAVVSDGANSDRQIVAKIARTAGQLDPRTRTLFTELEVDNSSAFLVPGSFAYVTVKVPQPVYPEIPVAGLIVRANRNMVATVGEDNTVRMRQVKVASTDGVRVALSDGLKPGEKIAVNLPDEVGEGSKVQPLGSR